MVRHGQRIDETKEGQEWQKENVKRWYDPPLTRTGHDQAAEAGKKLLKYFGDVDPLPFTCVYASPLIRTMQTASEIAAVLSLPVQPDAGLATCTSAFKKRGEKLQKLCTHSDVKDQLKASIEYYNHEYTHGFEKTLEVIAENEFRRQSLEPGTVHNVLVVTHREGQRDMSVIAGEPFAKTPYCGISVFDFIQERTNNENQNRSRWALVAKPMKFEEQLRQS